MPHSETKKSNYEKLGEKRKVKQEFSCANKDWLKRSDIVEVTSGEAKPVYFTAAMAKKYAVIYMFALYFGKGRVWSDRVLELLGWDHKRTKQQYTMILYRLIRALRQDFNIVISVGSISRNSNEFEGYGTRFYKIEDYGLFSKPKLFTMLKANSKLFINIIENGLGTNSFIYTNTTLSERNKYKYKKNKDSEK